LKNRVPEKFEALIIKMMPLRLMAEARMGQSLGQEKRIAELIADPVFKGVH
jgi:hypothetical protein